MSALGSAYHRGGAVVDRCCEGLRANQPAARTTVSMTALWAYFGKISAGEREDAQCVVCVIRRYSSDERGFGQVRDAAASHVGGSLLGLWCGIVNSAIQVEMSLACISGFLLVCHRQNNLSGTPVVLRCPMRCDDVTQVVSFGDLYGKFSLFP
ncbi:MAG: hypothetical protein K0Q61_2039 [Rhodococcus erythropolis]|nr:hypothetical protein [Rhodococcus erythropolis]